MTSFARSLVVFMPILSLMLPGCMASKEAVPAGAPVASEDMKMSDESTTPMMETHPARAARDVDPEVQDRPVRDSVGPVLH